MKKSIFCLAIIIMLVFTTLTACTVVTTTENEIEVTVTSCEQGEFHPHPTYAAAALKCLKEKKATLYAYYSKLAEENGTYDYIINFCIEGNNYNVVRSEEYKPGDIITVIEVKTLQGDTVREVEYQ